MSTRLNEDDGSLARGASGLPPTRGPKRDWSTVLETLHFYTVENLLWRVALID